MNALGRHLLIELHDCNKEALNDLGFLQDATVAAAIDCGAVVLGKSFHLAKSASEQSIVEAWTMQKHRENGHLRSVVKALGWVGGTPEPKVRGSYPLVQRLTLQP